jgi:hypothetical protein
VTTTDVTPPSPPPIAAPAPPPAKSASFASQAATFSLVAPLLCIGMNVFAGETVHGNRIAMMVLGGTCALLIIAGLVLGIVALFATRRHGRKGILGKAVAGVCINGIIVALMVLTIPAMTRAARHARAMQNQSSEQNTP